MVREWFECKSGRHSIEIVTNVIRVTPGFAKGCSLRNPGPIGMDFQMHSCGIRSNPCS